MVRPVHVREAGSGDSKQSGRSSKNARSLAASFVWHAIKLVPETEIQCEAGPQLEIIFEEEAEFALLPVPDFVLGAVFDVWRRRRVESLIDAAHGTAQVEEQCLSVAFVRSERGNRGAGHARDRRSAGADDGSRHHCECAERSAAYKPDLSAAFERVPAVGPGQVVAVVV